MTSNIKDENLKVFHENEDKEKNNPAIRTGFKYIKSAHYWTSSPNLSYTKNALNIDFRSGETYHNAKKGICYVRCVRGNYKL